MMRPTPKNGNRLLSHILKHGLLSSVAIGGVWCLGGIEPSDAQTSLEPAPIDIPIEEPFETVPHEQPLPQMENNQRENNPGANHQVEDGAVLSSPVSETHAPHVNAPHPSVPSLSPPLLEAHPFPPHPSHPDPFPPHPSHPHLYHPHLFWSWYQLNRGDRISIEVFDAPEYSGEHEIFSDGTVSIPLAGTFQLRGLTLAEAEALIESHLATILRRPFTTVRLLEERPLNLAVTGEVYSPGTYTLSLDELDGVPTVTKAIQLAEGIRLTADIRHIEVRRTNPYTNHVDEVFIADLWQLLEYGDLSQDIPLEDGDSIVIPEADVLSYDEVNVLAYANISPDQMTVNVVGEVVAPGAIQVKPNTPLHQAILAAGGFDINRAKKKKVLLIRLNPDGTVLNQEIEIDFEQGINAANNPPLRPYDTIVVGRSNFTKVTDILRQALSPISQFIGILRIFGL